MKYLLILCILVPLTSLTQTQVSQFILQESLITFERRQFLKTENERFFLQYDDKRLQLTQIHLGSIEHLFTLKFGDQFERINYLGIYDEEIYFSDLNSSIIKINIKTGLKEVYSFDDPGIYRFYSLYVHEGILYFYSGNNITYYYAYDPVENSLISLVERTKQVRLDSLLYESQHNFTIYNLITGEETIVDSIWSHLILESQYINDQQEIIGYHKFFMESDDDSLATVVHIDQNHNINFGKQCADSNNQLYEYEHVYVVNEENIVFYNSHGYDIELLLTFAYSNVRNYSNSCIDQGHIRIDSAIEGFDSDFYTSAFPYIYKSDKAYMYVSSSKIDFFEVAQVTFRKVVNLSDMTYVSIGNFSGYPHTYTWNNDLFIYETENSIEAIPVDGGPIHEVHDGGNVTFSQIEEHDEFHFYSDGNIYRYNTSSFEKTFLGEVQKEYEVLNGLFGDLSNVFWHGDNLFFNANTRLHVYDHEDVVVRDISSHNLYPGILDQNNYVTLSTDNDQLYLFQLDLSTYESTNSLVLDEATSFLARSGQYIYVLQEHSDASSSILYLDKDNLELKKIEAFENTNSIIEGSGSNIIVADTLNRTLHFLNGTTLEVLDLTEHTAHPDFYDEQLLEIISEENGHFTVFNSKPEIEDFFVYNTGQVYFPYCEKLSLSKTSENTALFVVNENSCVLELKLIDESGLKTIQEIPEYIGQNWPEVYVNSWPYMRSDFEHKYTLLSGTSGEDGTLMALIQLEEPYDIQLININENLSVYFYEVIENKIVLGTRDWVDPIPSPFTYKFLTFTFPEMELIHELIAPDYSFLPQRGDYAVSSNEIMFRLNHQDIGVELSTYNFNENQLSTIADINPGEEDSSPNNFMISPDRSFSLFLATNEQGEENMFIVENTTSIEEISFGPKDIFTYPNPTADLLFLNEAISQATVHDVAGNLVLSQSYLHKGQGLDVSQMGNGVYFLKGVTATGITFNQKFMVMR